MEFTTQHTLKSDAKCTGIGVHSGQPANLVVKPAPVDAGITFVRTDVSDKDNRIPARWDHVVDTQLCTVLGNKEGITVGTVEHLLSALSALGVDNAVIEIDGPEIPIMDGSAEPFVFMVECVGLKDQAAARKAIRLKKELSFEDGEKKVTLKPSSEALFSFDIEFDSKVVGKQSRRVEMSKARFKAEISQARTFGFMHEVEMLQKMGLARGGSLENAIVIENDEILNEEGLRYKDEFVRHKILDAVGDLSLAGVPILAHYHGIKAGHMMNNKILRQLFSDKEAWEIVTLQSESKSDDQMAVPVGSFGTPVEETLYA